jgi:hypothetical protein
MEDILLLIMKDSHLRSYLYKKEIWLVDIIDAYNSYGYLGIEELFIRKKLYIELDKGIGDN